MSTSIADASLVATVKTVSAVLKIVCPYHQSTLWEGEKDLIELAEEVQSGINGLAADRVRQAAAMYGRLANLMAVIDSLDGHLPVALAFLRALERSD